MPTAKTYEKYPLEGEPFKENGRMYVYIRTPKSQKKVRWYTDAERARLDKSLGHPTTKNLMDFNARHAFGFDEAGFITIYKGNRRVIEHWAEENHESFRYNLTFEYYTPSRLPVPPCPAGIEAIKLLWSDVCADEERMRPHEEISPYVHGLLGNAQQYTSSFQGLTGDWIQHLVTITDIQSITNAYGDKNVYTMRDDQGNCYQWSTNSLKMEMDEQINLKMKVKDHKTIDNVPTTIVWYCKVVK